MHIQHGRYNARAALQPESELIYTTNGMPYHVAIEHYPDSMPRMDAPFGEPEAILLRPQSFASFVAAMFWVDALRDRGIPSPRLILPNIPGARQDRLNDSGDYLFTMKSVARLLNERAFPRVDVLDPHSEVAPALINNCVVHHAELPDAFLAAYTGVISPDAGAEKRAGRVAKALGVPLYHAWKSRDVATGKITGFGVEPLMPGHLLVVDDLCDAGGTFIGLAEMLNTRAGVVADLYVTHGLFTAGTRALLDRYNTVITTDSTLGEKPGVLILDRASKLLLGE